MELRRERCLISFQPQGPLRCGNSWTACLQHGNGAALARDARAAEERQRASKTQKEAKAAYQAALVAERIDIALLEGRSMREDIQSKAKAPYLDAKI